MQNPEYPGFGRSPIQHRVFPTYKGKPVNDDELVFNTQSGMIVGCELINLFRFAMGWI
jgi:hypothetical protein